MYVYQAGQAGGLGKLDDLRSGWNREAGTDALNLAAGREDDGVVYQILGLNIQKAPASQRDGRAVGRGREAQASGQAKQHGDSHAEANFTPSWRVEDWMP